MGELVSAHEGRPDDDPPGGQVDPGGEGAGAAEYAQATGQEPFLDDLPLIHRQTT